MKKRTVFAECRDGAHEVCPEMDATSECACWHHVLAARPERRIGTLIVQVEAEVNRIWANLAGLRD